MNTKNYNKRITTTFTSLMLDPHEGDRMAAQEEERMRLYDGGDPDAAPEEPAPKLSKQDRMLAKYKDDLDTFSCKEKSGIEDGVVRDRGCRDILCLIVFLAFISVMMGCTVFAFKEGHAGKLLSSYDKNNHFCGYNENGVDLSAYPYLYIPSLPKSGSKSLFNEAVCVKSCPAKDAKIECSPDVASSEPRCQKGAEYRTSTLGAYCIPRGIKGEQGEQLKKGIMDILG